MLISGEVAQDLTLQLVTALPRTLALPLLSTHLQGTQNLHGTKDLHLGAGVVGAQEDFSLGP